MQNMLAVLNRRVPLFTQDLDVAKDELLEIISASSFLDGGAGSIGQEG